MFHGSKEGEAIELILYKSDEISNYRQIENGPGRSRKNYDWSSLSDRQEVIIKIYQTNYYQVSLVYRKGSDKVPKEKQTKLAKLGIGEQYLREAKTTLPSDKKVKCSIYDCEIFHGEEHFPELSSRH